MDFEDRLDNAKNYHSWKIKRGKFISYFELLEKDFLKIEWF